MRKWYTYYGEFLYDEHQKELKARFYRPIIDLIFYGLVALLITICACAYVRYKLGMTQPAPWTIEREAEPSEPINFYWE